MAPIIGVCEVKDSEDAKEMTSDGCSSLSPPLVVAFVGLPARGKTIRAHKLTRYLNWIGESAEVFVVSEYRRKLMEQYDNHNMFRADNCEAMEIRRRSSMMAMEAATTWLRGPGSVAVLDGTNITATQRRLVQAHFTHQLPACRLLFVECVCDDDDILSRNIKEVLVNSPDYLDMAEEKAQDDFHHKIQHYLEQYEAINAKQEPGIHFIKLINEGESIVLHRVQGHLESKVVTFLSNFSPAPKTLYFSRHGESENNVLGKIGGDTDLSPRGRMYGTSLARHMNEENISDLQVWTSLLRRTKQTAEGIAAPMRHLAALNELHAGVCEGLTYEEMHEKYPQEFAWRDQDKLQYRYPWGESYVDIMTRLEPVLLELEHETNILVVSHQAVLRCVLGYFLNKLPEELPYINVPLHSIIKITTEGYNYKMELVKLPVECVDTYRKQPKDCGTSRSADKALGTVPSHFNTLNFWQLNVNGQSPIIGEQ